MRLLATIIPALYALTTQHGSEYSIDDAIEKIARVIPVPYFNKFKKLPSQIVMLVQILILVKIRRFGLRSKF